MGCSSMTQVVSSAGVLLAGAAGARQPGTGARDTGGAPGAAPPPRGSFGGRSGCGAGPRYSSWVGSSTESAMSNGVGTLSAEALL